MTAVSYNSLHIKRRSTKLHHPYKSPAPQLGNCAGQGAGAVSPTNPPSSANLLLSLSFPKSKQGKESSINQLHFQITHRSNNYSQSNHPSDAPPARSNFESPAHSTYNHSQPDPTAGPRDSCSQPSNRPAARPTTRAKGCPAKWARRRLCCRRGRSSIGGCSPWRRIGRCWLGIFVSMICRKWEGGRWASYFSFW